MKAIPTPVGASSSPSPDRVDREDLEQQREVLNRRAAEHKRRIRHHRQKLHDVGARRRRVIALLEQFGIELVEQVDDTETGQGVEETHGHSQETHREEAHHQETRE